MWLIACSDQRVTLFVTTFICSRSNAATALLLPGILNGMAPSKAGPTHPDLMKPPASQYAMAISHLRFK